MTGTVLPFPPRRNHNQETPAIPGRIATPVPIQRAVYTVAEIATMLDLSLGSTYTLIRSGDIPAKKMGARWVIPKRRFETWLNELPEATDNETEHTHRRSS